MEERKAILHIMPDEKFIDYFIEQSEEVAPGISEYWVFSPQGHDNLKMVKSKLVKRIYWPSKPDNEFINLAKEFKKIIFHSFYAPTMRKFIYKLPETIRLYWMFWGSDGYMFTSNIKRWYMPQTWIARSRLMRDNSGLIKSYYREFIDWIRNCKKSYLVRSVIRRMEFCLTWIEYDCLMLKHINPDLKYKYYSYFSIEQLRFDSITQRPLNLASIWIGNSATLSNNHLDAMLYLKSIDWKGEVVVPLSYGDEHYRELIIKEGTQLFGNRFRPIIEFLPVHEYHELMNQSGIIWMNHIRQQASGNTLSALYMGKVVIMNEENNVYKTLRSWGIQLAEKTILSDMNNFECPDLSKNREILSHKMKKDISLKTILDIYQ